MWLVAQLAVAFCGVLLPAVRNGPKLVVAHSEECIRGWSVIGKRSMCPFCGEKVDTASIFATSPWEKSSATWLEFLDLLRMSLVWNPLIFVTVRLGFWVAEKYW